jgi:hypothetical protein
MAAEESGMSELLVVERRTTEPRVAVGQIVALHLFDIAYSIDLVQAEKLWAAHAIGKTSRSRLSGTPPKAMAFGNPPLALALDPVTLMLGAEMVDAAVTARLYDFGAVSLSLRIPVHDVAWADYVRMLTLTSRSMAPGAARETWATLLSQLRAVLGPALGRPSPAALEEEYIVASVTTFDERLTAAELLQRVDLAVLLSGETRPLADGARNDLLRSRFSYYVDDLVVLGWDRAFVYEPRGDSDVADVLEVANAQLLEMRYYDELLDDELPRMYDLVETARRGMNVFAARRYATLARRLYTLVAEVTELTERIDNALQVTEDVYLARVYSAALDLFRVPLVTAAVNRKLAIIRDTYAALYDEASSSRSELMEMAVILLIMLEVVLALVRH